jgi:hypothetical protein
MAKRSVTVRDSSLRWTTRRDSTWGTMHVLRAGRRELIALWWIRGKRWRVSFEAYPPDRNFHMWLGRARLSEEAAKREAVRQFYRLCAELRTECDVAMNLVKPFFTHGKAAT